MNLPRALAAWSAIVGAEHVITGGNGLESANQTTFAVPPGRAGAQSALAIVEPATREEVAACVQVAGECRVPIFPVSTGRNYGYGSIVSSAAGGVLLRLRRLDRVVALDAQLATVTVEPGVTFTKLADYLVEHARHLLPPQTGGPADGSVMGVILDRGLGKGSYQDLGARMLACEVVLASGEILRTGFGSLPDARLAGLARHGPGPALAGLFQQSTLGVVTSLALALDPAPALTQLGTLRRAGHDQMAELLDRLRPDLQRPGAVFTVELINDYREIVQLHQFPFSQLSPDMVLSRFWGEPRWNCAVSIAGESTEELAWKRTLIPHPGFNWQAPVVGLEMPGSAGLATTYWRKRVAPPAHPQPDLDRCGVLWFSALVPMLGTAAATAVRLVESILFRHQFEPAISLRSADGRSVRMVVGLLFDRDQPQADERAAACHADLWQGLAATGIYPNRFSLLDRERAPESAASLTVRRALKTALDPNGIFSPGRYD